MKKTLKKVVALILAGAVTFSLAACGNNSVPNETKEVTETKAEGDTSDTSAAIEAEAVAGKDCTIGVAFYQDAGLAVDATKAYLESMAETLHVTFKYTVLTQTDEAANLTKIQELISSGVDGIISTMDLGTTSIIQECEAAGVYLAGYLSDYDTSFTSAYDEVFKNKFFLGTAADGQCIDDVNAGITFFNSLLLYNETHAEAPITHVSMAIFPAWAFPAQQIMTEQFMAAVEEYNKTAELPITVDPLNEETDVLNFAPMDTTYFAKHADTQAIISFAAGTSFVYPTMVQAGVDKEIKLFTSGLDGGEEENFGTAGSGAYQQNTVTTVESITYPLVLLLNKINETEFADQPTEAERVSSSQFIINSEETLAKFMTSLYYTGNVENALYTAEEVVKMTAYGNPEATYADLKAMLSKLTVDDIK